MHPVLILFEAIIAAFFLLRPGNGNVSKVRLLFSAFALIYGIGLSIFWRFIRGTSKSKRTDAAVEKIGVAAFLLAAFCLGFLCLRADIMIFLYWIAH